MKQNKLSRNAIRQQLIAELFDRVSYLEANWFELLIDYDLRFKHPILRKWIRIIHKSNTHPDKWNSPRSSRNLDRLKILRKMLDVSHKRKVYSNVKNYSIRQKDLSLLIEDYYNEKLSMDTK